MRYSNVGREETDSIVLRAGCNDKVITVSSLPDALLQLFVPVQDDADLVAP